MSLHRKMKLSCYKLGLKNNFVDKNKNMKKILAANMGR